MVSARVRLRRGVMGILLRGTRAVRTCEQAGPGRGDHPGGRAPAENGSSLMVKVWFCRVEKKRVSPHSGRAADRCRPTNLVPVERGVSAREQAASFAGPYWSHQV